MTAQSWESEEMMEVHVNYHVPVVAVVDTDTGEVTQVVVIDEAIELDAGRPVTAERTVRPGVGLLRFKDVVGAARDRAIEAAESGAWPGWQFGW